MMQTLLPSKTRDDYLSVNWQTRGNKMTNNNKKKQQKSRTNVSVLVNIKNEHLDNLVYNGKTRSISDRETFCTVR